MSINEKRAQKSSVFKMKFTLVLSFKAALCSFSTLIFQNHSIFDSLTFNGENGTPVILTQCAQVA